MARRVGVAEVIARIDEAAPHQVPPDAVDLGAGEERVVGPGHPIGELGEAVGLRRCVLAEEAGSQNVAGDGVAQFGLPVHEDDLLAVEFVLIELVAPGVRQDAILDAREERGEAVVVGLRPLVERVVVALRALEADAEEHLRRGLRPRVGVAEGAVVVRCGPAVGTAARGDEFARELVHRLAVEDGAANPGVERLHAARVENLLLVA